MPRKTGKPDNADQRPVPQRRDGKLRYLKSFTDRHGKRRNYFRRRGLLIALPGRPGSAKFIEAYRAALAGTPLPPARKEAAIASLERASNGHRPAIGVYLLMLGGEIVYVGSSLNMHHRVAGHRIAGRPFDQVFYIGTKLTERIRLERALIAALAPRQNRIGVKVRRDRELPAHESGWAKG
jgi:hypothetical protein